MRIVTIDFETHYDKEYSLSKLTTEAYVRDARFEVIGVGVYEEVGDVARRSWMEAEDFRDWASQQDWAKTAILCHHTHFDGAILAWHFGINPGLWLDTLSMSRAVVGGFGPGGSLAKLASLFGIGEKGTEVLNALGKRRKDFTSEEWYRYGEYCLNDCELTLGIFRLLSQGFYGPLERQITTFPKFELKLIDKTIRMFTEPAVLLDPILLTGELADLRAKREKLLAAGGVDRDVLMSNPKFAEALQSLGATPPTKISPTTGKVTWAFAKTDKGMTELLEHENEDVQALAAARLGNKSTIAETRIERLLGIAARGPLPVYLNYCGADQSHRFSGGDKLNCFTGDVEVLTPTGWMRFDAWRGEPVMQWWPDGTASFCMSPEYIANPHLGDVVRIDAPSVSATVTPDHRLVRIAGSKVVERPAAWLLTHSGMDNIPTAGVWRGATVSEFSPAEVRLLVAIAADGHVVPRRTTRAAVVFGFRRPRKLARIKQLLAEVGVAYTERQYEADGKLTTHVYIPDCKYEKGFGDWILRLDRAALDALCDELVHWDGQKHSKNGNLCFWSSDATQSGWVATALHLSGKGGTVRTYPSKNPNHAPKGLVYQRDTTTVSIDTNKHVMSERFNGTVYCTTVESSYIFVRRQGKICVMGQCQNLPKKGAIRSSLCAPPGHRFVVVDSANIEARVLTSLAGEEEAVEVFRRNDRGEGDDVYCYMASKRYGRRITKADKEERQFGKILVLACGYSMGGTKFKETARQWGITLTEDEAQSAVADYRNAHPNVVKLWRRAQDLLPAIRHGNDRPLDPAGLVVSCRHGLVMSYGLVIKYPNLRQQGDEWVYDAGKFTGTRIYGGKCIENVVQALARAIVMEQSLEVCRRRPDAKLVLSVHDEAVYVVPEADAEDVAKVAYEVFCTSPSWWPAVPLSAEAHTGFRYSEAK